MGRSVLRPYLIVLEIESRMIGLQRQKVLEELFAAGG
jgi:hypothetical protein